MKLQKTILALALAAATNTSAWASSTYDKYTGAYGPHSLQKADLYMPPAGPYYGLLVWIHGGAWESGDKSAGLNNIIYNLVPKGIAVLSMNYRLRSDGAYPNSAQDVQTVLTAIESAGCPSCSGDSIWQQAQQLSRGGVMVAGFSSGGYLAIMGSMGYLTTMAASNVRCVTNIAGPVDLRATDKMSEQQKRMTTILADGQPSAQRLVDMSPVSYLSSGYWNAPAPKVTWYLRYGLNDTLTPFPTTQAFTQTLVDMNIPVSHSTTKENGGNAHNIPDATIAKFITEPAYHCLLGVALPD